ncbi:zf-HC2 domain-containing protein [Oleiharenicola lentus]|uniref:zf-HC2 domain-containing protein n=1 Tax=Oleiharenicola lentus TaxID=2508720 RepID=UPI003F67EEC4
MNCQRVQDNFIDYQDGTLPPDESAQLRAHLTNCPTCQREWSALQEITRKLDALPASPEPSTELRENFYAMLESHQREADAPSPFALARSRIDRFFAALLPSQPALQFAFALALLAGGLFVGQHFMAKPALVTPTVVAAVDDGSKAELEALKAQVNNMGLLVTQTLLQQQTTSNRLQNVLATMDLKAPDRQVLTDLVGALAFDPSINVRLSAVEALAQHAGDELVRAGVLNALSRERAPLVQVAMIELLANAREPNALPVFDQMSRDEAIDINVRDAARRALASLRTPTPASPDNNNVPAVTQKTSAKPVLT